MNRQRRNGLRLHRLAAVGLLLATANAASAQPGELWSTVGPGELRTAPVALTVNGMLTLGVHGQDRSITYYGATGEIEHQVFVASTTELPPVQHGGAVILLDELGRLVYSDPAVGGWRRRDASIAGDPVQLWSVGSGYLVVLSQDGERQLLTGLSPTGHALWRRTLPDHVVASDRAGTDLVLALADGRLLAVQLATGPLEIAQLAPIATIACSPGGMFVTLQGGDLLRLDPDACVRARRGFPAGTAVVGTDSAGRVWVHSPATSAVHIAEPARLESTAVYRAVERGVVSVALLERDGAAFVVGGDGSLVHVAADGSAQATLLPAAGFDASYWLAELGVMLVAYPDWSLTAFGVQSDRPTFRSTRVDRRRWSCVEQGAAPSTALSAFTQAALRSGRAADRERLVRVVLERIQRADLAQDAFQARDALIAVLTEPLRGSGVPLEAVGETRSAAATALGAFGDAAARRALVLAVREDPDPAVVVAAIESLAAYPLATTAELSALAERLARRSSDRTQLVAPTIDYLSATIATDQALYNRVLAALTAVR